jgi:hypothetical protein
MRKSANSSVVFLSLVVFLGLLLPVSGIRASDRQTTKTEIIVSHRVSPSRAVPYCDAYQKFETDFRREYRFMLRCHAASLKIFLSENHRSILIIENQTAQQYLSIPYRNNDHQLIFSFRG